MSSIHYAPGFDAFTQVTQSLYYECFLGPGIHISYKRALQEKLALVYRFGGGVPALHSRVLVNNQYFFFITEIQYVAYSDGALIQFALSVPQAPGTSRALPDSDATIDPGAELSIA